MTNQSKKSPVTDYISPGAEGSTPLIRVSKVSEIFKAAVESVCKAESVSATFNGYGAAILLPGDEVTPARKRIRTVQLSLRIASDMSMPGGTNGKQGLRFRLGGPALKRENERVEPKRGWSESALFELFEAYITNAVSQFRDDLLSRLGAAGIDRCLVEFKRRIAAAGAPHGISVMRSFSEIGEGYSVSFKPTRSAETVNEILKLLGI